MKLKEFGPREDWAHVPGASLHPPMAVDRKNREVSVLQTAGKALTSDGSVNRFIIDVYEKFL